MTSFLWVKIIPKTMILCLIWMISISSHAAIINFSIEGNVYGVNSALSSYISRGDAVGMDFTVTTDTNEPYSNFFAWYEQPSELNFSIGNYQGFVESYKIFITNGGPTEPILNDVWSAEVKTRFGPVIHFPMLGHYFLDTAQLEYRDWEGEALVTTNLLSSIEEIQDPAKFDYYELQFVFKDINNPDGIGFSVNAKSPNVAVNVPEPVNIGVILFCIIGLAWRIKKIS